MRASLRLLQATGLTHHGRAFPTTPPLHFLPSLSDARLPSHISYPWLRDACPCPLCIDPATRQKLRRTTDVPPTLEPAPGGVRLERDALHVRWPDGHASTYPLSYLYQHASPIGLAAYRADAPTRTWDAAAFARMPDAWLEHAEIGTDVGLLRAIDQLTGVGLVFVRGVPTQPTDDEGSAVRALALRLGHEIRETIYGRMWDVRNIRKSKNIAFTNLDLGFHIDLMYFQHPPRFQILHCIRNRVRGGASLFVDALHSARQLSAADIRVLSEVPVPFHYVNDGKHLHHSHPAIELGPPPLLPVTKDPLSAHLRQKADADGVAPGPAARSEAEEQAALAARIRHVNYSPPFQAPLLPGTPAAFYPAFARLAAKLNAPTAIVQQRLQEGDAVLFDNRRVLHARTAFEGYQGESEDGETDRWMKGCYWEADAMLMKRRQLMDRLGFDATE